MNYPKNHLTALNAQTLVAVQGGLTLVKYPIDLPIIICPPLGPTTSPISPTDIPGFITK